MKQIAALALFTALSASMIAPAVAVEYTKGEVTKIDEEQKKITIRHEELKNLEMPAMTMVFNVADEAMLDQVEVGQQIEFVADRIKGKITITELK